MKITTLWLPLSAKNQRQNNGGENTKEDHAENNGGASEAKIRDEASNEAITRVFFHQEASFSSGASQVSFDNSCCKNQVNQEMKATKKKRK